MGRTLTHYFLHVSSIYGILQHPKSLFDASFGQFSVVNHYLKANSIYITNELVLPVVEKLFDRMPEICFFFLISLYNNINFNLFH